MEFSENCQSWIAQMESASDDDARRILQNLRDDPCIDDRVAHHFSARLAEGDPPSTARSARRHVEAVVADDPDRFLCTGRVIPDDGFAVLFRIERISNLDRRLPGYVLAKTGLTGKAIRAGLSDEDLRTVTSEYDGPINLGTPDWPLVWVADHDQVKDLTDDLRRLIDRLGLDWSDDEAQCILCAYNREDAGRTDGGRTLHVPRALDAVDSPQFEVNRDCSADHGQTRPITRPIDEGLNEAVHRNCSVVPSLWQARTLA